MKLFKNNPELEKHRVMKPFLDVTFGGWCGMLMGKKTAKKFIVLQKQFILDVKKLLANNLDDIEVSNWSLDYSDGEQRSFHFIDEEQSNESRKIARISLLDRQDLLSARLHKDVFKFENYEHFRRVTKDKECLD